MTRYDEEYIDPEEAEQQVKAVNEFLVGIANRKGITRKRYEEIAFDNLSKGKDAEDLLDSLYEEGKGRSHVSIDAEETYRRVIDAYCNGEDGVTSADVEAAKKASGRRV